MTNQSVTNCISLCTKRSQHFKILHTNLICSFMSKVWKTDPQTETSAEFFFPVSGRYNQIKGQQKLDFLLGTAELILQSSLL